MKLVNYKRLRMLTINGKTRFGLYKVIRYSKRYYCRIYLVWKLMDIVGMAKSNYASYLEPEDKIKLKTLWSIHPFKKVQDNG